MARLSMRTRLLCAVGAVGLMTAIPVAPGSAQGLNDIFRNLNNTVNPNGAQRREDQTRREDQARQPRDHHWDGDDRRNYGDRRDNAEGRQPTFSYR